MSSQVVSIEKDSPLEDAARLMTQKKLRHLLVKDRINQRFIGIISATDLALYLKKNMSQQMLASEVWELFF